jgi:hypothetical protein
MGKVVPINLTSSLEDQLARSRAFAASAEPQNALVWQQTIDYITTLIMERDNANIDSDQSGTGICNRK